MTFLKSPFYVGDATVPGHTQRSAHATQQAGQTERDDEKHPGYGENHAVMRIRHGPRPNHPVRQVDEGLSAFYVGGLFGLARRHLSGNAPFDRNAFLHEHRRITNMLFANPQTR